MTALSREVTCWNLRGTEQIRWGLECGVHLVISHSFRFSYGNAIWNDRRVQHTCQKVSMMFFSAADGNHDSWVRLFSYFHSKEVIYLTSLTKDRGPVCPLPQTLDQHHHHRNQQSERCHRSQAPQTLQRLRLGRPSSHTHTRLQSSLYAREGREGVTSELRPRGRAFGRRSRASSVQCH